MTRNAIAILLVVIVFVLISCVSKSELVEMENRYDRCQEQIEMEQQRYTELDERFGRLSNANEQNLRRIDSLERQIELNKIIIDQKEEMITRKEEIITEKEETISELEQTRKNIEENLKDQIEQKNIKLQELEGKLRVTFVDKILFNSGSVNVNRRGQESLLKLAESLRQYEDQLIVVEGHTDDVQIGPSLQHRFPSNWELSTARAAAVVRFLQEEGGIDPHRMTATGFSYFRPVASNETEEGRSQNRRIEIVLAPVK
ncbi:MAG TPA: OmpA family protein [Desulfobacterales bacterium]